MNDLQPGDAISGDEMAERMGLTPDEFTRQIAEVSRRPRVLVVPDRPAFGTWAAHCEECGAVDTGVREAVLTIAHRHNDSAHAGRGAVRALTG